MENLEIEVTKSKPTEKRIDHAEYVQYFKEWQNSGLSKRTFCKAHGISAAAFYDWGQRQKRKASQYSQSSAFIPASAKLIAPIKREIKTTIEIHLPNQTQLVLHLEPHRLVSFIQELSNAVTVIR